MGAAKKFQERSCIQQPEAQTFFSLNHEVPQELRSWNHEIPQELMSWNHLHEKSFIMKMCFIFQDPQVFLFILIDQC